LLLEKLKERLKGHERPLRFLIAGGINTLMGLTIFPLIVWLSPWMNKNYMVALVLAQVICTVSAFLIYRSGVFSASGRSLWKEFSVFCSFYLVNYAVNWVALPILVRIGKISPIYAQSFFVIIVMVGSYFWHSRMTFRKSAQ